MTITLSGKSWVDVLTKALSVAKPGDIIEVDSAAKAECAVRAVKRMGVSGVGIQSKGRQDVAGRGNRRVSGAAR